MTLGQISREEAFDHSIENIIRKTIQGFAGGILPAFLFLRRPFLRSLCVSFAAGLGCGLGVMQARFLYVNGIVFDHRIFVTPSLQQVHTDKGTENFDQKSASGTRK